MKTKTPLTSQKKSGAIKSSRYHPDAAAGHPDNPQCPHGAACNGGVPYPPTMVSGGQLRGQYNRSPPPACTIRRLSSGRNSCLSPHQSFSYMHTIVATSSLFVKQQFAGQIGKNSFPYFLFIGSIL